MSKPILQCKTTPGVGDYMYALNKAFMLSWRTGHIFDVEFHWNHGEDHLHHFEDPETIVERFDHTLPYYLHHDRLNVSHHFNSVGHEKLDRKRFYPNQTLRDLPGVNSMAKVEPGINEWSFKPSHLEVDANKVVIWRPLFNAETARDWKRVVSNQMWEDVISILEAHGYQVVELTYRTPIREAHYHIATCDFVVCYDGMWHYFAKNYNKPTIVTSRSAITKMHTPHALMLHELDEVEGPAANKNIVKQMKKLHIPAPEYHGMSLHEFLHDKANRYKSQFENFYNAHRQSSN